jgi:hypothetical protein
VVAVCGSVNSAVMPFSKIMRLVPSIQSFQIIFVFLFIALSIGCLSSNDLEDAKAAASKVHSQMQSGDYASIYRESAPRFKSVGSESQFVSKMQEVSQVTGALKKAEAISFEAGVDSNIGKTYTLLSELEFERGIFRERMIFTRSDSGQMQLWKLDMDRAE